MNIELIKKMNQVFEKILLVAEEEGNQVAEALGTDREEECARQLNATVDLMEQYLVFAELTQQFWKENGIDTELLSGQRTLH